MGSDLVIRIIHSLVDIALDRTQLSNERNKNLPYKCREVKVIEDGKLR